MDASITVALADLSGVIAGGTLTVVVALLLGRTGLSAFRHLGGQLTAAEGWLFSYALGSALLSSVTFGLCAVGWLYDASIVAVSLAVVAGWMWWGRRKWPAHLSVQGRQRWLVRLLLLVPALAYGTLYIVHTLAPETRSDAMGYHLGLVYRYYRDHGFSPITTNIYAQISQGAEMLYLFAYGVGRESAAKIVHFSFLVATGGAIFCLARRFNAPLAGVFAAVMLFTCPVVIPDATSAYNDCALAFALLMTFYALAVWWNDRSWQWLLLIGLFAGFSFAIKYTGVVAVMAALVAALATFTQTGKAGAAMRALLISGAAAASMGLPWLVKNVAFTGNPLAPFFNGWFRNRYVSIEWEQAYLFAMKAYRQGPLDRWDQFLTAPFDLVFGERYAGSLGWLFLLSPVALLALRRPFGRALIGTALVCALPWLSNAGARFLIPSMIFGALALGLVIESAPARFRLPLATLLLAAQCVTSWPPHRSVWYYPNLWSVEGFPWRAALRLEPQKWHLARNVEFFLLADRLGQITSRDTRVLSFFNLPEAYFPAELLVSYQGLENQDLADVLLASAVPPHGPDRILRATWPARSLQAVRVQQQRPADSRTWTVSDVRLLQNGAPVRLPSTASLDAFPHPWHAPRAFDGDIFSAWNSREPPAGGMFLEARFGTDLDLDGLELIHPSPAARSQDGIRIQGIAANGEWIDIRPGNVDSLHLAADPQAAREAAAKLLRKHRIQYVVLNLSPADPYYRESRIIATDPEDWGLRRVFVDRSAVLLALEPVPLE